MRTAVQPQAGTAATLRRLAARRDRQEQALADTRAELGLLIRQAIREGAKPQAISVLTGYARPYIYRLKGDTT